MEDCLDKVLRLAYPQRIELVVLELELEPGQALVEILVAKSQEKLEEFDSQQEIDIVVVSFEFAIVTYLSYY
jgi:hypothetical protein